VIAVAFVDFSDTERLVVLYSSAGADFEKVRHAVIKSMFSWRKLHEAASPTPAATAQAQPQ
jgi:hypothetical protein